MQLTAYSRNKILETFNTWRVPQDFADPMYNYLVYGFNPGSCFTSILANDFFSAIRRSHPANRVDSFKALVGWINDVLPASAYGNYEAVDHWTKMEEGARRKLLESRGTILTEEQEVWMVLNNVPTTEPPVLLL